MQFIDITDKLKDILSLELGDTKVSDKDLAQALNINHDSFRKKKSRNSIPYLEIMQFLAKRKLSINYFFFNQTPETLIEPTSNYIILNYKNTNASAGGGAFNYQIDSTPIILDQMLLEYVNANFKYTELIKVLGDSMEPLIPDNSLIFIDKSKTTISTGVYLISTTEGLFIKQIKQKDNKYILQSINQNYVDIELESIEVIGKVVGVFNKLL